MIFVSRSLRIPSLVTISLLVSGMSTWSKRDFEFSEGQADREYNCPQYRCNFEDTRTAKGTKWQRSEHQKKTRSKLTVSDVPSTRLFSGVEKFKEYDMKLQEGQRHHKLKKCVKGCRRDELAQEGLLEMKATGAPEPLNSVIFSVRPPEFKGCGLGKYRKIGLYLRTFE